MKIILAPDSYKGSLTAIDACAAMEKGIEKAYPDADIKSMPMADGGEGTVDSLVRATNGKTYEKEVVGPLGEPVKARYGILGDGVTAVIEMAEASGLYLISVDQRNPMKTTTFGTGQLIKEALDRGCRKFILGIGGSATNDGGVGMASALGVKFLDKDGRSIGHGGGSLKELKRIEVSSLDSRIKTSTFQVACDVDNPLCGKRGASFIFGPQKGADEKMVIQLDKNLAHYARIIERDLGVNVMNIPGAGAAGGLGAGMLAFLGASLKPGVQMVIETVKLEEILKDADLLITGEGKCDSQTIMGKTPFGLAKIAQKYNVPVVIIAGSLGDGAEALFDFGVIGMFSMVKGPISLDDAMRNGYRYLSDTTENVIRTIVGFNLS